MQITNNAKSGRILPDGMNVPSGGLAAIDEKIWDEHKKHPVVKAWLDAGELAEVKAQATRGAKADEGKK